MDRCVLEICFFDGDEDNDEGWIYALLECGNEGCRPLGRGDTIRTVSCAIRRLKKLAPDVISVTVAAFGTFRRLLDVAVC